MKPENDIRTRLRDWVIAKNGKIRPEELDDQTPILEQRILSSLQAMDLILFLEQLTDRPIGVEMLQAGVFRSIDMLYRHFFAEGVPHSHEHRTRSHHHAGSPVVPKRPNGPERCAAAVIAATRPALSALGGRSAGAGLSG